MTRSLLLSCACLLSAAGLAQAQGGSASAEWVTSGSDAQRSHSIPADPKISVDSLQKPGFQFLWKTKLDNQAVQLNSLMPAILMDRYIGYRGFRSFAFVAGGSNTIYAIDTDLDRIEWRKRFPVSEAPAGSAACPGGLTSPVARATSAGYPTAGVFGGLGGRAGPAHSDVGSSGEGAVTIAPALLRMTADGAAPRPPGPRLPAVIYVISSDGKLHTLNVSNGDETESPKEFLPPNSNAQGLVVIDNVAYAGTHDCDGAPAGVWALDIASKQVSHWTPVSGDIAGAAGPAFGPDGELYVTTTAGELVALAAKSLAIRGAYTTALAFTSSPMVFPYKEQNLIAAATIDGRIHILNAASLATPLAKTDPYSASFAPQALASWQSPTGVRWLLAAPSGAPARGSGFSGAITHGAVAAWKIGDHDGALALEPGWISRDLVSPLPPLIVNGVVFALASGEYRSDDNAVTAAQRVQRSSPAVLYALDGATGKVLWNSGNAITSFVHSGGLSGGASQLYLATYDETIYAFGFPIEH